MPANEVTSFDYTDRLGIQKMPPGYLLIGLDSGHFIFERVRDEAESPIHWNRWAVWRWAWQDYKSQQAAKCTNEDSWNCKYCRKTETCEALKDERNFGAPPTPPQENDR